MTTAINDDFDLDIQLATLEPHSVPLGAASSHTSNPHSYICCSDACCG
jgi:hypothetical protein